MECTVLTLLKDGGRVAGAFGYERERGRFRCSGRRRSCWRPAASAARTRSRATAGNTPATATRSPIDAGAELMDMEFVQFHPTGHGLAAERPGHSRHRRRARRRRRAARTAKAAASCSTTSRTTTSAQTADNEEEGWRYTQGDKNARRPPELLTRDHVARCIVREVKAGRGSPHGGVFLDIAWIKEQAAERGRAHQEEAAEHVSPVQAARRHRHHEGADGSRADDALHHGRRAGGRRHADVDACRACSRRASAPPASTAPTASAATRCPTCSCSASGPANTRRSSRDEHGARRIDRAQVDARRRRGRWRRSSAETAARIRTRSRAPAGHDAGPGRHRPHRSRDAARARGAARGSRARAERVGVDRPPRIQPRLAHRARSAAIC